MLLLFLSVAVYLKSKANSSCTEDGPHVCQICYSSVNLTLVRTGSSDCSAG